MGIPPRRDWKVLIAGMQYVYGEFTDLRKVTEPDESPLTCIMMHPDGFILATGTEDNLVRIWDLRTQKNVATFRGHKDQISALRVRVTVRLCLTI